VLSELCLQYVYQSFRRSYFRAFPRHQLTCLLMYEKLLLMPFQNLPQLTHQRENNSSKSSQDCWAIALRWWPDLLCWLISESAQIESTSCTRITANYAKCLLTLTSGVNSGSLQTLKYVIKMSSRFLEVLTRYARTQFTAPKAGKLDFDHQLLLTACQPLLLSRNAAVVLKVVATCQELGTDEDISKTIGPLMALASGDRRETKFLALELVYRLACSTPHLVSPYLKNFTIFWAEPEQTALLKIKSKKSVEKSFLNSCFSSF
jgi:hypothetical protein